MCLCNLSIDHTIETELAVALVVLLPLACVWSHLHIRSRGIPRVLMAICCAVVVGGSCTMGLIGRPSVWAGVVDAALLLCLMLAVEIARALAIERIPRARAASAPGRWRKLGSWSRPPADPQPATRGRPSSARSSARTAT